MEQLFWNLYFLPYLIARKRSHRQDEIIFWINLWFGWTVVGWFVALLFSCLPSAIQSRLPAKESALVYRRAPDGRMILCFREGPSHVFVRTSEGIRLHRLDSDVERDG